MSVLQFERYPVDANRTDGFEGLVQTHLTQVRSAPGVLWADASKASDDEPSYILLSEWRTEADLEAWEAGAEAQEFLERLDVHLRGEPTRRRFTSA